LRQFLLTTVEGADAALRATAIVIHADELLDIRTSGHRKVDTHLGVAEKLRKYLSAVSRVSRLSYPFANVPTS
jgi:hypothetical protein